MDIECGECRDFVEATDQNYGGIIEEGGFRPVECLSERGGRECLLMLASDRLKLLFVRSDGAETCQLGALGAAFPEAGLHTQGESGWYNVISLLEFKTGEKLLTRQRLDKFLEGKQDYFAWQAELLLENSDLLFEMLEGDNEESWSAEFQQYYQALTQG